jgi:hypothetical protein
MAVPARPATKGWATAVETTFTGVAQMLDSRGEVGVITVSNHAEFFPSRAAVVAAVVPRRNRGDRCAAGRLFPVLLVIR